MKLEILGSFITIISDKGEGKENLDGFCYIE